MFAPPTQAGYLAFIRNQMGIAVGDLPDNSPWIATSYLVAVAIVSLQLNTINPDIYTLAVYNLAGDRLLNYAQDTPPSTFFTTARGKDGYNINAFSAGVVQSAGDETTNSSLLVPEFMKNLTLMDLQNLKTPYGLTYLQFAQLLGTLWGLT